MILEAIMFIIITKVVVLVMVVNMIMNKFDPYDCNHQNNNSSAKNNIVLKDCESKCYRNHTCCTTKHLVDLYEHLLKRKTKMAKYILLL